MHKAIAAVALTAGIAVGSIVVAAANPMGLSMAQSQPTTPPTTQPATNGQRDRHPALQEALDELVKNGTLTQAQADAVMAKMKELAPKYGHRMHGFGFGDHISVVADAIGITPERLMQELRDGKSIAAVAKGHGVDPQKVINAIVKQANERIDGAVKDGHLDKARADDLKKNLVDQITKMVNGTLPPMPFGGPRDRGPFGPHDHDGWTGPGGPGQSTPPSTTSPSTPSTPKATPKATPPSTLAPTTTTPTSTTDGHN
jgi:polyhydroxyalkanoate synthesis regulator phasin